MCSQTGSVTHVTSTFFLLAYSPFVTVVLHCPQLTPARSAIFFNFKRKWFLVPPSLFGKIQRSFGIFLRRALSAAIKLSGSGIVRLSWFLTVKPSSGLLRTVYVPR